MEISQQQWDTFARSAEDKFRGRVREFLRNHLPQHTAGLSDGDLEVRISRLRERAAAYGVSGQRAIAKWAFLALVLGEEFDRIPAIHQFLSHVDADAGKKMDLLMETLEICLKMPRAKEI